MCQESGDGRFGRRQVKFSGAPTLKLVYYVQTAVRQRPEVPSPDIFAGNRTKMTKRSSDPFAARRETRSSRMIHRTTFVGGTVHSDSGPSKPLKSTKRGHLMTKPEKISDMQRKGNFPTRVRLSCRREGLSTTVYNVRIHDN